MSRPLEDLRIISLEQYGAGPFATVQLADLGAEVIKIEDPAFGGDVGRYVPPYADGEDSLFFEVFNRNKKSISLDITNPSGREVFERLVRNADVVFSNLRGDVPEKLRIRYEDLSHVNRAIVCCSLTGFGMTGPRRAEPGYDYILQGLTGWMDLTGEPDGPPTKSGLSLVDYSGGFVAAIALLSAVHVARRDGVGSDCDVSLYDTALSLLTYPAAWYLTEGFVAGRTHHSAHPSLVPFQNFETADGWIVVGCAKEKFWQRLAVALDRRDLLDDPRFVTFATRLKNRHALLEILEESLKSRSTAEWVTVLQEAGVPCSPVLSLAQALEDPHCLAREMIIETEHPRFGSVRQVAGPVRVGSPGADRFPSRRAPQRNEDAHDVLTTIAGLDESAIAALAAAGAFGPTEGLAGSSGR
jgi:crotonobetainyl-CoA:carnitine CoA-transferase CaiB-like acyl-CoA transferase